MQPDDPRYKEIPPKYHSAFCLDDPELDSATTSARQSGSFGYPSVLYKVVSQEDGFPYALRRFDNVKCSHKIAGAAMEAWKRVRHPNIVKLSSCYVLNRALFFVHEYFVGSSTLTERYLDKRGPLLQERLVWSYVVQCAAILRAIHGSHLACRAMQPTHILRTPGGRVRINCVGVVDVLEFEARKQVSQGRVGGERAPCLIANPLRS